MSFVLTALALLAGTFAGSAAASDWPTRPITVVSPYAAGGPSDTAIRTIADRMGQALGQPLIVENIGGAGGMIGAARVARAAPDGYTLLIHQNGLAIAQTLYPKQAIDVAKELSAVGMVNVSHSFLVGNPKIPAKTFEELVVWMKGPGKPAKFAHPGLGTLAHMQAILLAREIGVDVTYLAYKGGGQAMSDVIGGHADLVWAAPTTSAPLIAANKVTGYGFGAPKRYPEQPGIPTFGQMGHPDLDIQFWQALFAPAGTPRPVIDKVNAALRETLQDPAILKAYSERGVEAYPPEQMSPEAADKILHAELEKWRGVIREAGITAEGN
ncbi:Bug family tripartite tricarboxylate transporter substrate binding protein [Rhodoplanes sp. SY1]|uniref:Bug family tripartite tricarboxylate transporter substrate binding protein n=1 Tax=Rhodoplanes sp. SY1 TaxID=3166646 RepID=UPI0038B4A1EF